MPSDETKADLEALRLVLAGMRKRLGELEEFRALTQLDEREHNGSPLQTIDGVLLRGRIVRQLEKASRLWRSYMHIETAIAELEGPDKNEPGLIAAEAPAGPIGPTTPGRAEPAVTMQVERDAGPSAIRPEAALRAGGQGDMDRAPHGRAAQQTGGRLHTTKARMVLDQIRLVPTIGAQPVNRSLTPEPSTRAAFWDKRQTSGLPPAIDAPPAKPVALASGVSGRRADFERSDDDDLGTLASRPEPVNVTAPAAAHDLRHAGPPPDELQVADVRATARDRQTQQTRLDAVEAELKRLIDDDVVIARRGSAPPITDAGSEVGLKSLEPDFLDDLEPDAEEAEVTIVRLDAHCEAEASAPSSGRTRSGGPSDGALGAQPPLTDREQQTRRADAAGTHYGRGLPGAAQHRADDPLLITLDVEEAAVEIIVHGASERHPSDANPAVKRR